MCRRNTIAFFIWLHMNGFMAYLVPLTSKSVTTLPLPAWTPYSLDSKLVFTLSYLHQSIGIFVTTTISAAMDSLALTVMLQICAQLEIIMHRLNLISKNSSKYDVKSDQYDHEKEFTKRCIKHHLYVYL